LSQARYFLAAAAIGDIVAFGGGSDFPYNAVVDIYNMSNYIWFTANLSQPRYGLAATSSTNKIFFGGGNNSNSGCSNVVDIYPISLPFSPTVPANSVPSLTKAVPSYSPSICFPTSPAVSCPSQSTTLNPSTSPSNVSTHNTVALTNSALIGGLVGALTGALLLVGGIVVLVLLLLQKKRKNKKLKNERNIEELPIEEQTRETVVLENYTSTIALNETNITTLTAYQTETLKELSPGQIPFNELEIGKEIGEGTYGRVCVGKWKQYRVALKFCQNKGKMDEFMREANLMISLPPHPNVVRMYGVSIDGTQPIIVMEYCGGGSLDKILYDTNEKISMEQKIRWVHEIAKGMYHLHKYNIVHRDLAARNILLSHPDPNDAHAKISDFGMSRLLQQNMVGKTLNPIGPIRWMSPESIGQQVYSKKSDVWMFGVLVYEIIAQREPHTTMEPKQILILIRDEGLAPTIPSDCPQKLRELMQMCWKKQPEQRPNFEMICEMLQ
jgi:predicted Ser/Thr protein kinase